MLIMLMRTGRERIRAFPLQVRDRLLERVSAGDGGRTECRSHERHCTRSRLCDTSLPVHLLSRVVR